MGDVTYGDVFHQNEVEMSTYNFEEADVEQLFEFFDNCESDCTKPAGAGYPLPLPAYEMVMKASHAFNLLDARHAISVTERQRYILRVRGLARACGGGLLRRAPAARLPPGAPRPCDRKRWRRRRQSRHEHPTLPGRDRHRRAAAARPQDPCETPSPRCICKGLAESGLACGESQVHRYASPRRLAVHIEDLQLQADRRIRRNPGAAGGARPARRTAAGRRPPRVSPARTMWNRTSC